MPRSLMIAAVAAIMLLITITIAPAAALTPVKIGAQFPIYKTNGDVDGGGRRRRAAFLMAIDHLNNKTDGLWDDVLPDHKLEFEVYDSKRDDGNAVVNAFNMWENPESLCPTPGIKALVGPASSGPTQAVQSVYKLPKIDIAQVGYSATSPQLSEAALNPTFSRLPPSDAFQAKVIRGVVCHYGWRNVCTLSGSDLYSAFGIKDFMEAAAAAAGDACPPLVVAQSETFHDGTKTVKQEIAALKAHDCKVVVLFAQAHDMVTVFEEAKRQAFTAERAGVLWFASELLNGAYDDVCAPAGPVEGCGAILGGALMAVPNYGPGASGADAPTGYNALADLWHAQATRVVGSPVGEAGLAGCDARTDARGVYLWQAQNGTAPVRNGACKAGSTAGCACAAVNFADFDAAQAAAHTAETGSHDGRISPYVPYAYDAAVAVAHGLHKLLADATWPGYVGEAALVGGSGVKITGTGLHAAVVASNFTGFSGDVSFGADGDRGADGLEYFLYNHHVGEEGAGFKVVGTFKLAGGGDGGGGGGGGGELVPKAGGPGVVWPGGGAKPDTRPPCDAAHFVEGVSDVPADGADAAIEEGGDKKALAEGEAPRCSDDGFLYFSRRYEAACVAGPFDSDARPCCVAGPGSEPAETTLECYYVPTTSDYALAVFAICGVGGLTNLAGLGWLVWRRGSRAVKAGQYEFLLMYVVGCLLLSLSPLAWLGPATDGTCVTRNVVFNVGASLVWAALAVKVWRVWRIFDNAGALKKRAYTTRQMIWMAAELLGLEAVLLAVWFGVPAFRPGVRARAVEVKEARSAAFAYGAAECRSESDLVALLQGCVHGVALLGVAWVSFRARHAPTAFQESRWLSLVLMEVVTVGGIVAIVYFVMVDALAPRQLVLVQAVGTNINTVLACLLMLVPKARGGQNYMTTETARAKQQQKRKAQVKKKKKKNTTPEKADAGSIELAVKSAQKTGMPERRQSRLAAHHVAVPEPPSDDAQSNKEEGGAREASSCLPAIASAGDLHVMEEGGTRPSMETTEVTVL